MLWPPPHSFFRSEAYFFIQNKHCRKYLNMEALCRLLGRRVLSFFKSGPSSLNELTPHNWWMHVLRSYLSETSEGSDHFSFTTSCGTKWCFSYKNSTLEFHVQLLPLPSPHSTSECCFTLEFVFQRTLFKYQLQFSKKQNFKMEL